LKTAADHGFEAAAAITDERLMARETVRRYIDASLN
jgi:hypothetical protein